MVKYTELSAKQTPQSQMIPGRESEMVMNHAGGAVFEIDKWKQMDRFLILGAEGGTYYSTKQKLVLENAKACQECLQEDGIRFVDRIVEVSDGALAAKNDQALFLLALAAKTGNLETRRHAFAQMNKVVRIGTHLFHFAAYCEMFGGWGRAQARAFRSWYLQQSVEGGPRRGPEWLARQLTKYKQRDGWSHVDIGKLCHTLPNLKSEVPAEMFDEYQKLIKYSLGHKDVELGGTPALDYLAEVEALKELPADSHDLVQTMATNRMPMEVVPTHLRSKRVYEQMMVNYGITALLRNLGNLGAKGILEPGNWDEIHHVVKRITDVEVLTKGRVHPIQILTAWYTYGNGRGIKGSNSWRVVPEVRTALELAFYSSFGNVVPAGKKTMLALDVSGSMWHGTVAGSPLSPADAAAAMAMLTHRTEPMTLVTGFTYVPGNRPSRQSSMFHSRGRPAPREALIPLDISGRDTLSNVMEVLKGHPHQGTDCAAPMMWALKHKKEIETFIVYTDNETWAGNIHPAQALQQYRREMGIPARLVVVAMTPTQFSIADPNDAGMMDVVGFDAGAPALMNAFSRGEI